MVARNENYDYVLTKRSTTVTVFDSGVQDGDIIDIFFTPRGGNQTLVRRVNLTTAGTDVNLPLIGLGDNTVTVKAVSQGSQGPTTVGFRFKTPSDVIFGEPFSSNLPAGATISRTVGLPKIVINGSQSPYAAQHILDVLPPILTLDRDVKSRTDSRRNINTNGYRQRNGLAPFGFQIDEVPPSSTLESTPEFLVSTRPIISNDNQSGGGQYTQQFNSYGGVRLQDGWRIELTATTPNYNRSETFSTVYGKLVPTYAADVSGTTIRGLANENNLIYGDGSSETIRGSGLGSTGTGNDIILAGSGNDNISTGRGKDTLLGQAGNDIINGGAGDDLLYGGPGTDTLIGGAGRDGFAIRRREGPDLIKDFNPANDKFRLVDGLRFDQLSFDNIVDGKINNVAVNFPNFPGTDDFINRGTRIRASSEVLAYIADDPASVINNASLYTTTTGSLLPMA